MKVLHIISGNNDSGASKGAFNLHKGLIDNGIDSKILSFGPNNIFGKALFKINYEREKIQLAKISSDRKEFVTLGNNHIDLPEIEFKKYDILHIHWFNYSLSIDKIRLLNEKYKVVVTARDLWMFTGGCHYNLQCDLHKKKCIKCPLFKDVEIANSLYKKKLKAFEGLNIITLSKWMESFVRSSKFKCKTHQIYNSVSTKDFYRADQTSVIKELQQLNNISNKKIILIGAINLNSSYKGKKHIEKFIRLHRDSCFFVFFGNGSKPLTRNLKSNEYKEYGFINSEKLNLLFNISDFFLMLSEQEAFGKVIIESILCNTPVITLPNGAPEELISLQEEGRAGLVWDGVSKINFMKGDNINLNTMYYKRLFSESSIALEHVKLYERIINN